MKTTRIIALRWLTGLMLCGFCQAKAEYTVPCMIFTGNSEAEHCIDLEKLNRITFGDDGMTISNSKEDSAEEVQLLYSLFHHLEIGDAIPTVDVAIGEINADSETSLAYHAESKTISLDSATESTFKVGVFDLKGTLLISAKMTGGESLPADALQSGVYVVIANDGTTTLTLKFIIN